MWLGLSIEFWIGAAIGIAGILISLLISARRASGQLDIGIVQSANLISEIAHEVSNLRVLYQNNEIPNELVWVSGVVVNTGKYDVGKTIVSQFPRLCLASENTWKEFSIIRAQANDVAAQIIDSQTVEIRWSLIKPSESVTFAALIATGDKKLAERLREGKGLKISARIENCNCRLNPEFSIVLELHSARRTLLFNASSVVVSVALFTMLTISLWHPQRFSPPLSGNALKLENSQYAKDMAQFDRALKGTNDKFTKQLIEEGKKNQSFLHMMITSRHDDAEHGFQTNTLILAGAWLGLIALIARLVRQVSNEARRHRYINGTSVWRWLWVGQ